VTPRKTKVNANTSIPRFTVVTCHAQCPKRRRGQGDGMCTVTCTETCARLAHFTDPLSTKAEDLSLERGRREMTPHTTPRCFPIFAPRTLFRWHNTRPWSHLFSLFIIVHMLENATCPSQTQIFTPSKHFVNTDFKTTFCTHYQILY
jgi:hypothetical protein